MDFNGYLAESNRLNEDKDCAVRALSAAAHLPYAFMQKCFANAGRRRGEATAIFIFNRVLRKLNITLTKVDSMVGFTVQQAEMGFYSGTYVVFTKDHVLTIDNGCAVDWSHGRDIEILDAYMVCSDGRSLANGHAMANN